jgi:predicted trehalose synthase
MVLFGLELSWEDNPNTKGYFMTQEHQDAAIGYVVRERGEQQQKLAALKAEAHKIGTRLADIADTLAQHPQNLYFESLSHTVGFISVRPYDAAVLNPKRLAELTNDIRVTMEKLQSLDEKARELHIA